MTSDIGSGVMDGDGRMIRSLEYGLCFHCGQPVGVPWVRCIGFPEHPECHERECQ